jgi:uncharacterized protein YndB with AHSA1/START domain
MVVSMMITFDVSVPILKPVQEVFTYVAHAEHGSAWNSAVREVVALGSGPVRVGSRYRTTRDLPGGVVENVYEVIEIVPNQVLSIRIVSGPTPFTYRYHFSEQAGVTTVDLHAEVDSEGIFDLLGAKARLLPGIVLTRLMKNGVRKNLETLKSILETA